MTRDRESDRHHPLTWLFNRASPLPLLFAVCIVAITLAHAAFTVLVNTPMNPIRLRNTALLDSWKHPLFEQRWSLFAPNPLRTNRHLLARCRGRAPGDPAPRQTAWLDLTAATQRAIGSNLLSPFTRILRMHMAGPQLLVQTEEDARIRRALCDLDPRHPACTTPGPDPSGERISDLLLNRMACAALREGLAGTILVEAVQTRVAVSSVRPFSKRYQRDYESPVSFHDSDWRPCRLGAVL